MNVLLLTTHLNSGGIGTYTVNLAKYLKRAGVGVVVSSSGGDLEEVLKQNSIQHISLDVKTKFEFGFKMWKALPSLMRIVKDNKIDLVHAQTRVTQVLGQLVDLSAAVPFVTTCHGFFEYRRLGRRLFPCWGRKVIAISKSVQRHLVEDFHLAGDRVAQVYTGIEIDRYSNLDAGAKDAELGKRIGLSENALLVGTIARLSPVKGNKYLISAFERASARNTSMQLLIVGDGPEKDSLERQVRQAGISDKVFFTSGNDASLERYFSLMDIFCLASVKEGLGLSLIEAMAAGRACIASNIGGLTELIAQEKDGILVPSEDPEALSSAILRLTEDTGLRKKLGEAAREKALSGFSIESSAAKTIEVYKQVLGVRL
ncbi:MAG: glycosyltransferase family 4 protein [Candidatus Omnitrophota bacterium]